MSQIKEKQHVIMVSDLFNVLLSSYTGVSRRLISEGDRFGSHDHMGSSR